MSTGDWSRAVFAAALVAASLVGLHAEGDAPTARPVAEIDAMRYSGTWYELARQPTGVLRQCAGDVTATYALRANGELEVVDRCVRHDGSVDMSRGVVRPSQGDPGGARLEANFWPRWLRRLSLGWDDHWVVALDPDYRVAVVSDRARGHLRVLSRVPELEPERLGPLLARLRAQGYAVDRLVRTPQASAGLLPVRTVNVMT